MRRAWGQEGARPQRPPGAPKLGVREVFTGGRPGRGRLPPPLTLIQHCSTPLISMISVSRR